MSVGSASVFADGRGQGRRDPPEKGARMAAPVMTADESELHRLVGTVTFLLGRDHVSRGLVVAAQRNAGNGVVFGQVGAPRSPHSAIASLVRGPDGTATAVQSECPCRSGSPCSHAVAVLLATLPGREPEVP